MNRLASGLIGPKANNLDPTTFLNCMEDRKCEKLWTLLRGPITKIMVHQITTVLRMKRNVGFRIAWVTVMACVVTGPTWAQGRAYSYSFHNDLMPEPSHLEIGHEHFLLQPGLTVTTDKFYNVRLDNAIHRVMEHLKEQTGVIVDTDVKHGTADDAAFVVSVDGPGQAVQTVKENESYELEVTSREIRLHAATVVGAMWGLQTLLQLVQSNGKQYFLPGVSIQDQPRFPWRGLMIDCSRHFIPISKIKQIIDGMAAVKMDVLHLHLSDDQGFRMQSTVFPLLTKDGSDGKYYTQRQMRELVAYARARGIIVEPEFDMPGHSSSWLVGYPQLASAKGPFQIQNRFGVFNPVMNPTKKTTYQFLNKFIGEMVKIFPTPYFSIGGDEVNGVEWKANPRIQAFMRKHHMKNMAALQAYFNRRVYRILHKYGKQMVGWDEVLVPGLPKSVTIQSWRGYESLAKAAREGHDGILSSGYYLSQMSSASRFYEVNPIPKSSTLTAEQKTRILGGEACMWTEHVNAKTIDSRIWPRAAAIAERLWSPESVNNVDDMYRRLRVESVRLEALGLTQISQEDASLRTMAGVEQIGPLRVLADTMEPVPLPQQNRYYRKFHFGTTSPLDEWVDALRPDPPLRHNLKVMVRSYLRAPAEHKTEAMYLSRLFEEWRDAKAGALDLMKHSPLLAQAEAGPGQLAQLGRVGKMTLMYLSSGEEAPAGWQAKQLKLIQAASQPVALTKFVVTAPLTELVKAVPESGIQRFR
jgi:hexosaminidase